jgi:hypothetical protein
MKQQGKEKRSQHRGISLINTYLKGIETTYLDKTGNSIQFNPGSSYRSNDFKYLEGIIKFAAWRERQNDEGPSTILGPTQQARNGLEKFKKHNMIERDNIPFVNEVIEALKRIEQYILSVKTGDPFLNL